jgi:ankyrin repeat protein
MRVLLTRGADRFLAGNDQWTPLQKCAGSGRSQAMHVLVADGAYASRTGDLEFALLLAAAKGHVECVRVALDAGASPTTSDRYGRSVLHFAVLNGFTEVASLLLDRCAGLEQSVIAAHPFLLQNAAASGQPRLVARLLDFGFPLSGVPVASSRRKTPPIVVAAALGHFEVFSLLLARTPLSAALGPDSRGRTALHKAAAGGHADVVCALLAAGADPNASDKAGVTPLLDAAASGDLQTVEALLAADAAANAADVRGETPLIVAARKGHTRVVARLIAAGADLAKRSVLGHAATDVARSEAVRRALLGGGFAQ